MKILGFPADDSFWLVKWIDDYRAGHLATSSASVCVLLQRMHGVESLEAIWQMSTSAVQYTLGKPPAAARSTEDVEQSWKRPRIHAGSIPLLRIGQVYRHQIHVATLPADYIGFELKATAGDPGIRELTVATPVDLPATWNAGKYLALNDFELRYVAWQFPRSRCWAITYQNIDFYIPHQLVFQTFYAPHTELAKAFTNGPWSMTGQSIVHAKPLRSGLLTKIDEFSGDYHIILETGVPDELARLVAMLYFDPYAKSCAELIFAHAAADRHEGGNPSWFASAKFPYRPGEGLRFEVCGYSLRGWTDARQRVLVTGITGARPPGYLPEIHWERVNSGLSGAEKIEVDEPAPYPMSPEEQGERAEQAGDDTTLTSQSDANAGSGAQKASFDTFSWIDAPDLQKLTKSVSRIYAGRIGKSPPPGPDVSTGNVSNEKGTVGMLGASSVVREPTLRFEHLMDALGELKRTDSIANFRTVQPSEPNQITHRGGLVAWSLLDEASRISGRWPKRGWRILRPDVSSGKYATRGVPRAALIVEVEFQSKFIYWVEIECRATESGYLSPVFTAGGRLGSESFKKVVGRLASDEGRYQKHSLKNLVRTALNAKLVPYKHEYVGRAGSPLDLASIVKTLQLVAL